MSEVPPNDPEGKGPTPEDGESGAKEGTPESPDAGSSDEQGGLLDEEEINELFSRPDIDEALDDQEMDATILPEGDFDEVDLTIDQADIEALLNAEGGTDAGGQDWLAAQEAELAGQDTGTGGGGEEAFDQASIDALLAGGQPDETDDMLDQSELDALVAGAEEEQSSDAIDQSEIDALTAAGQSEETPDAVDQSEIDALMAAEQSEETADAVDQSEIDALMAAGQSEETADAVDQSEIDALMAAEQSGETADAVDQSEIDALMAAGQPEEAADAVDQSEIDALMAAEQSEEPGEGVGQSEIDALTASGEPVATGDEVDQAEIDALLSAAGAAEAGTADASGEAESPDAAEKQEPAEPAADAGAEKGKPVHPAQAVLDALVAAGLDTDEPPADDALAEVPSPEEGGGEGEEEVMEPVPDAGIPDLVSSENVAASAQADEAEAELVSQELVDSIAEEAAAQEEKPEEVAVPSMQELAEELGEEPPSMPEGDVTELGPPEPARGKRPRGPLIPPDLVEGLRKNLARIMTSAAVGLVFAGVTYLFLQSHREQTPPAARPTPLARSLDIQKGVTAARELIGDRRYGEALDMLERLLAAAPAGVDTTDAEFLRIEAAYQLLPEEADLFDTESVHFAIDRFADKAPDYPRLPEALLWKADLYERGDMLYEARRVYDRLLTNFGAIENLDEVLFAAAELNLELKRYSEAAEQLGRVLTEFPGASIAGDAMLLLADTYVERGDRDAGREIYEQIVSTQPETRLGAQAFTRLGEMALEEGRFEEGIRLLEARLETATTIEGNERVYLTLARAYRDTGRPEDAEQLLRELIDFFPESEVTPDALVELSGIIASHGKRRDALQIAMQAAQRYPDNPAVTRHYAELLMADGRRAAAAQTLLATYAGGDADPDLLLTAGRLLRESYEPEQAKAILERITKEFPSSPQALEARLELAKTYRDDDEVREAVGILEGLLASTKEPMRRLPALTTLAEMYRDLGIEGRAAELYTEVARTTNEPKLLSTAALALFEADSLEQGLAIAARLDPATLSGQEAYAFLNTYGRALLRIDASKALEKMEQAYESYPAERTGEGDFELLKAYLTVGRYARARAMVSDIEAHVQAHPVDAYRLQQAAIVWGDDLYERGDYRAAAEAYEKALNAMTGAEEDAHWARFQRANALFNLSEFEDSVILYDEVAGSTSPWAAEAGLNAASARLEQRLRGLPVTPQGTQG